MSEADKQLAAAVVIAAGCVYLGTQIGAAVVEAKRLNDSASPVLGILGRATGTTARTVTAR